MYVCNLTSLSVSPNTTSPKDKDPADVVQGVSPRYHLPCRTSSNSPECAAPYVSGPGKSCVCPAANKCGGKCYSGPTITCAGVCYVASDYTCPSQNPNPNPIPVDKKDKAVPRRRSEIPFGRCSFGQELCPVATSAGYECVNTISDMESCKSIGTHTPCHELTFRWRMRTRVQRYRQTRTRLYRHPQRRRGHVQPRSMSSPVM